jgi:hypothetical protein
MEYNGNWPIKFTILQDESTIWKETQECKSVFGIREFIKE